MRELMSLIKVNLNINFGISSMKYKYLKQKKDIWKLVLFVVAILSLIPVYLLYIGLINGVYLGLSMINQQGLLLLLGFLTSQIVIFLFGIVYVMSKFYFSDDLNILIPLPIKPSNIITAKFITLVVNEYLIILPIMLPIIIIFGIRSQTDLLYWIYSIGILLLLPIIPLGLASIIVMIFMKYTNIKGKRDLLRVIGMTLLIIVILIIQLGIQFTMKDVPYGSEEQYIAEMVKENNSFIKSFKNVFPPSRWAAIALANSQKLQGFTSFVLFVISSILVFYMMIIFGENIFYKGVIGGEEVLTKRKLSKKELEKDIFKSRHPIIAIFYREIKILLRTPVFFVNSIVPIFIIPVIIIFPAIANNGFIDAIQGFCVEENISLFNLILIGFVIFIAATNSIASTSFSREGKQFWISRIVPIRVGYQLIGKILLSILLQLLTIVVILVAVSIFIRLKLSTVIIVLILGLLGSIPVFEIGLFIDITRPLLDWDNPQKAMKQNLNVLFSMLLGMVYLLLYAGLVFVFYRVELNSLIVYFVFSVMFLVISFFLFISLIDITVRRYREIE
ncbi:putative ABC transporter permease subunit [Caloranaerobacter sp. DY30410]|uniref:putative ABC transporter permease subunit n=1 Tax=Caloranaerobacter sp. DY30410 TaxID=3238305 RepID=UPI003D01F31A